MAINFAHVVPKEEVEKYGADFGQQAGRHRRLQVHRVDAGPAPGARAQPRLLAQPGVPNLDKITFEFGQEPTVALLRLQSGEVDVLGDGIPPAQFPRSRTTRDGKDLIVEGGQLHTGYVTMNVNMPPFDNVEVRQAVNMAINKDRIVQHHQQPRGAGQPAAAAGDARLRPRTTRAIAYDPEGAKKLLAEAGLADGFETELYAMQHRSQPAHRPGDPAGSRRGRHQGRDQVAGPGRRDRRRRREARRR